MVTQVVEQAVVGVELVVLELVHIHIQLLGLEEMVAQH